MARINNEGLEDEFEDVSVNNDEDEMTFGLLMGSSEMMKFPTLREEDVVGFDKSEGNLLVN